MGNYGSLISVTGGTVAIKRTPGNFALDTYFGYKWLSFFMNFLNFGWFTFTGLWRLFFFFFCCCVEM
jgi:hypothetical protein